MEHPSICAQCALPALSARPLATGNDDLWFCCRGCREVYTLLHELQEAA